MTYLDTSKNNSLILKVNTSSHGVYNRFRLFKNFFLHERAVISCKNTTDALNTLFFLNVKIYSEDSYKLKPLKEMTDPLTYSLSEATQLPFLTKQSCPLHEIKQVYFLGFHVPIPPWN